MTKGKLYELTGRWGYSQYKLGKVFKTDPNKQSLLDEAKKEFPFWYMYDGRTYKQYELTDEQFKESAIIGLDSIATNQWFKKWFGDES